MINIYLVRHGQTEANIKMRFQGHQDNPLNELGLKQAEEVAKRFKNIKLDAIYSRPLLRAKQTAKPLAEDKQLPIQIIPGLQEISFGKWEGLTFTAIKEQWPEELNAFFTKPKDTKIPEGESFKDLEDRAFPPFDKVVRSLEDGTSIAVVSHGGVVRALECAAIGIDLNNVWNIAVDNSSVSLLQFYNNHYLLKTHNSTGEIE